MKLRSKITVFYDCDNDGICSGVMMCRYLRDFTDNVHHIIFPRSSGHGLKGKEIPDTGLLIIVDSSTNDVAECLALKERGIEVIIIDHHPITTDNPYVTLVNNQDGNYPNTTLSGSGVVLKVLEVMDEQLYEMKHFQYYDLAAVGIIGDMMSLNNPETRTIIAQGFSDIQNEGIKKIFMSKLVDLYTINTMNIAFALVPIINGATRMNQSEKVIELLLCDDPNQIAALAKECIKLNDSRKVKQQVAFDNVQFDNTHNIIFCVENELAGNMRGLIAANLANEHQKPAIVVSLNEETGTYEGSARGYNTVNFRDILSQSELVFAEGHPNAFGVQVSKDDVDALIEYCNRTLKDTEQVLYYDLEITPEEITNQFMEDITILNRITGKDCDAIKVKVNGLSVAERKIMGKNGGNVKLVTEEKINAVKFGVADTYADEVGIFDKVDVVGQLQLNKWYNNSRDIKAWVTDVQILMDDYRRSGV